MDTHTGGADPLRFVDVETEDLDGVTTVHKLVDQRLIQESRRSKNFKDTSVSRYA